MLVLEVDHRELLPLLLQRIPNLFLLSLPPLPIQHGLLLAYLVIRVPPAKTVKKCVFVLSRLDLKELTFSTNIIQTVFKQIMAIQSQRISPTLIDNIRLLHVVLSVTILIAFFPRGSLAVRDSVLDHSAG